MLDVVETLRGLVAIPSFSREEDISAQYLYDILHAHGQQPLRYGNNVVAWRRSAVADAPVLVLNSHHDTVRPSSGWSRSPHEPAIVDGKLYGLGSNDAGGALVTMLAVFLALAERAPLPVHVCFAATAEEEVSGTEGMERLVRERVFGAVPPALVLVGEPTGMQLACAEKGLLVLECTAHGIAGHAARGEGVNAIYAAMRDMDWFASYAFPKASAMLGNVKMTVTQVQAGSQHNVVPDTCHFVVDVRVTDAYTNEEVLEVVREHVSCDVAARSMRLRPSCLPDGHMLHRAADELGVPVYGSPTMSDQSLLPSHWPSVKIGPGESARSHTTDEFLYVHELTSAPAALLRLVDRYLELI